MGTADLGGHPKSAFRGWLLAAWLGIGFAAAQLFFVGLPPMPPVEAQSWFPWLALVAVLIAPWAGLAGNIPLRSLLVFTVSVLAAVALFFPLISRIWPISQSLAVVVGFAAASLLVHRGADVLAGAVPSWVHLGTLAASAGLLAPTLVFGGSALFGMISGILAAITAVAFIVGCIQRDKGRFAMANTPFALLFTALAASGYLVAEVPFSAALLAIAGPLVGAPLGGAIARRKNGLAGWIIAAGCSLLPVAIAAALAYQAYDPAPSYY